MNGKTIGRFVLALIVLVFIFLAMLGIVNELRQDNKTNIPEIVLPVLLIAGITILLLSLGIMAGIFSAMGLANPDNAMGLPEGSIRAVIALGLILIFAIIGVFLYTNLRYPTTSDNIVLTRAQFEALPADTIYFSEPVGTDMYRVKTVSEQQNKVREDIAKNLLNTISTLVVAVAGFYFGAKSVSAARGAVGLPTLTLLTPTDRPTIKRGEKVRIRLQTDPSGLKITGRIEGDAAGSLTNPLIDEFVYEASDQAQSEVKLIFSLAAHPGLLPVELPITVESA